MLAGNKLARLVGRHVSDQEAAKIGFVVRRALGIDYGMAATALARTGIAPLVAGMVFILIWANRSL